MKQSNEKRLEEIISYYGSLEAYNEEQRRINLAGIEAALRENPFTKQIKMDSAMPEEVKDVKQGRQRFWLKFSLRRRKVRPGYISR